ncbi:MAG: DNA repair protein RecO [Planctomycetaceae bacterium]|nr:DNA repair protein RecO [Planctomycetaceae bacterium]
MESDEAVVIRSIDFSETSRILTLFTKNFGKIEAIAKGGRRLKSPFENALDLLARISVTFLLKKGDVLDLLTEAKLNKRFNVKRNNQAGLYAGYYAAELVNLLTQRGDPSPNIYNLLTETLDDAETAAALMKTLLHFEGRLLEYTGHKPALRFCTECNKDCWNDDETNNRKRRIAFGLWSGGVLCRRCETELKETEKQHRITVSPEALKQFDELMKEQTNWKQYELDGSVQNELRGLMNQYICGLVGKKPRLFDWFPFIIKYSINNKR